MHRIVFIVKLQVILRYRKTVVTRNGKCMAEMPFQDQNLLFQKNEIFLPKKLPSKHFESPVIYTNYHSLNNLCI